MSKNWIANAAMEAVAAGFAQCSLPELSGRAKVGGPQADTPYAGGGRNG
jgi:hypothetical protein